MTVQSEPGKGTRVKATFKHSHIDRQPLGNLAKTLETLIVANPGIRFRFYHQDNGEELRFDSGQPEVESANPTPDATQEEQIESRQLQAL